MTEATREEEVGVCGPGGLWFRDILGVTWHLVVGVAGVALRGGAGKCEAEKTEPVPVGIIQFLSHQNLAARNAAVMSLHSVRA